MSGRTVVEEPRFSQDLDGFRRIYEGMDDVYTAVAWALSRDPRLGEQLRVAPDFRVLTTTAAHDTPSFWILYTFDAEHVYLHSIEEVKG
jgi:hypothetical protein